MKLFLASQDLGDHAETLQKMVGDQRRAFVISNARDYYQDEAKIINSVEKTLVNLGKIGIQATRLDLKPYFGKELELSNLIEQTRPGLIFSIGGSPFCLSTAMHASGLDNIIRRLTAQDQLVYGGYSAGSMVAADNLSLYQIKTKTSETQPLHEIPTITRSIYSLEPYRHGLGLIPQYIIPHMDRLDHIDHMHERLENINQANAQAICLNDSNVYIVNEKDASITKGQIL